MCYKLLLSCGSSHPLSPWSGKIHLTPPSSLLVPVLSGRWHCPQPVNHCSAGRECSHTTKPCQRCFLLFCWSSVTCLFQALGRTDSAEPVPGTFICLCLFPPMPLQCGLDQVALFPFCCFRPKVSQSSSGWLQTQAGFLPQYS